MTATTPPILTRSIKIAGITKPAVLRYFETLNAGDFEATASLFAEDGVLHAPFEEPIIGKSSIRTYLKTEARGMQLEPKQGISQSLEDGKVEVHVSGRVQTSAFGINVRMAVLAQFSPGNPFCHCQAVSFSPKLSICGRIRN